MQIVLGYHHDKLNFCRYRSQVRIKRKTFTTSEACGKNFQVLLDVESNWAILKENAERNSNRKKKKDNFIFKIFQWLKFEK